MNISLWKSGCLWKTVLSLAVIVLICHLPSYSQGGLGTINGTITAPGAGGGVVGPVGGATVTVIDVTRGEERTITTSDAGLYSASGLIPGPYTVRVTANGFKTMEHTGITVTTGATLTVDFLLETGGQSEVVTITAAVLPANASAVVQNQQVNETPINGRSFVSLIEGMTSGQATIPGNGGNRRITNGNRPDQNNPLIDGVYDGDIDTNWQNFNGYGFQGGIDPDTLLPLDSISEINNTAFPQAGFGGHPGNTSNLGIKSGTNAVHGTAYAYGRDADLNTRNPFRPPSSGTCNVSNVAVPCDTIAGNGKTGFAMEQWGASIGGPIKKDKLFYFLNYERQRYDVGSTVAITEPTTVAGLGTASSIPDAIYGIENTAGQSVNQLALNLAGCGSLNASAAFALAHQPGASGATFAPYCNSSAGIFNNNTGATKFPFGVPSIGGPDSGVAKIDYHLNEQNSINGEYLIGNATSLAWTKFSSEPWWMVDSHIRMQIVRGVWVYSPNSSMINEARVGVDSVKEYTVNSDCNGVNGAPNYISTFGFNSGSQLNCAFPVMTLSGFSSQNISPGAGPYESEPRNYIGVDTFSLTLGKHVLRFGVEIREGVFTGSGGGGTGPPVKGILNYGTTAAFTGATAIEDFLVNVPTNGTIQVGGSITNNVAIRYYAGFMQDTWRITRRVTVDLGLRYEFEPPFSQPADLEGYFNPNMLSGVGQELPGQALWHVDTWRHNFSPRGQLAWDLRGNGRTVVRIGGNIMYAQPSYSGLSGMQNTPTGATFYAPTAASTGSIPCSTGAVPGFCTFTNPQGQNTINFGQVTTLTGLPFNVCNPGLTNGISCSATQTVFGSQVANGLRCGDGLPLTNVNGVLTGLASEGVPLNPAPCNLQINSPNLYTPYITQWTLSLQQALGRNFSLNLAYVGSHGNGLRALINLNQPALGPKNAGITATGGSIYSANAEQDRTPFTSNCPNGTIPGVVTGYTSGPCFPWLGQVYMVTNSDMSNFDALQASVALRAFHGVTGNLGYILQSCHDDLSTPENVWALATNYQDPHADYGICTDGTPNRITGNINWEIPGMRSPAQLLQGWAVNATMTLLPDRLALINDTTDDTSGTGINLDRWNIFGPHQNLSQALGGLATVPCYGVAGSTFAKSGVCATSTAGSVGPGGICSADALLEPNSPSTVPSPNNTGTTQLNAIGCYVVGGTVLLPPAQGTYGDMTRDCCLAPGFFQVDASVTKTFGLLKEQRLKAQFRAEFFNIFNLVNYAAPTLNLGAPATFGTVSNTNNQGAFIVTGVGSEREAQLGMKFIW